jgi:metal-responsive CopG/Arc/MetJ family transcriptional regulator
MTEFSTVRIPKELADEADTFIGKQGYSSRAEVVKDALRKFFKEQQTP